MAYLLIQSCSATKQHVVEPVQALDLYDGYFFRIIKKASRANQLACEIDILIISAEHGVVEPDEKIEYYDRRMDTDRARELNDSVVKTIARKVSEKEYEKLWINLGKDYLPSVDGLEDAVDPPIRYIEGRGIGVKGKRLKNLVSSGRTPSVQGD